MGVEGLVCRDLNLCACRDLLPAGLARIPAVEGVADAGEGGQRAVLILIGNGLAVRVHRNSTVVGVKAHGVGVRPPPGIEGLVSGIRGGDLGHGAAGAAPVSVPAVEGIAGAARRRLQRHGFAVGVACRVGVGQAVHVSVVDRIGLRRAAELSVPGHVVRDGGGIGPGRAGAVRRRVPAGEGAGVAGFGLGGHRAGIGALGTVLHACVRFQRILAVHPCDGVGQAVVVDLDHGGAVGLDGLLGHGLCRKAGVGLGCGGGGLTGDAAQRLAVCFNLGVLVILNILLIVLDRVVHGARLPVGVEGLARRDRDPVVLSDLLAAVRLREPAGKGIADSGGRGQLAVDLGIGDGLAGDLDRSFVGVKGHGVLRGCPAGVERHRAGNGVPVEVPLLGAVLIRVPAGKDIAGSAGLSGCGELLAGFPDLAFNRAAAVGVKGDGVIQSLPLGVIAHGLGGGGGGVFADEVHLLREGRVRVPAGELIALAGHVRRVDLRLVGRVGADQLAVVAYPVRVVRIAVVVNVHNGGAVGSDGQLLIIAPRLEAFVFLRDLVAIIAVDGIVRYAGQLIGLDQLILAVELLLIVVDSERRVGILPPIGVEGDAVAQIAVQLELIGHGRGEGVVGHPRVEAGFCPVDKGIAHARGALGRGKLAARCERDRLHRAAAAGVEADGAHILRVAPCDVDDLLNRLGGERQRGLPPCDGHVRLFLDRAARRDRHGVGGRVIAELRVGEADAEVFFLPPRVRGVHAPVADPSGLQIHAPHIVGRGGQSHGLDALEGVLRIVRPDKAEHVLLVARRPQRPFVGVDRRRPGQLAAVEERGNELDIQIHAELDVQRAGGIALLLRALLPFQMIEEVAVELRVHAHLGNNADPVQLQ